MRKKNPTFKGKSGQPPSTALTENLFGELNATAKRDAKPNQLNFEVKESQVAVLRSPSCRGARTRHAQESVRPR